MKLRCLTTATHFLTNLDSAAATSQLSQFIVAELGPRGCQDKFGLEHA